MGRLGVKDAWYVLKKPRSSLSFSRAGCSINGFCMSRIDRIYISSELEKYGNNVEIIAGSDYISQPEEAKKRPQPEDQ